MEKLYKDEQVTRKRYFNQMEDMKGKIRVFCRIRPILGFERDKGQQFALNLPDDLTITHLWKDEKKQREYNFDQVGGGGALTRRSGRYFDQVGQGEFDQEGWDAPQALDQV